jgi:hypothetical protein
VDWARAEIAARQKRIGKRKTGLSKRNPAKCEAVRARLRDK